MSRKENMKKEQITSKIDYKYYPINWNGYVGSEALGCDTKKEDNSGFWFFAFWIALFS